MPARFAVIRQQGVKSMSGENPAANHCQKCDQHFDEPWFVRSVIVTRTTEQT